MAKPKSVSGAAKKGAVRRTKKASTVKVAAAKAPRASRPRKKRAPSERLSAEAVVPYEAPPPEAPAMSEEQAQVVASKFAGPEASSQRPLARPTLPSTYGESHLLLLVRDPQTLFAAWDIAASTLEALKGRLGRRGFAVSTLTLRLTRAGGGTSIIHVANKTRSRYIKIDGGPSFVAEIGFTTPAGRFELLARSAPCFVPMGPLARQAAGESARRAVVRYREARALSRAALARGNPGGAGRAVSGNLKGSAASAAARVLGGASDLYRR